MTPDEQARLDQQRAEVLDHWPPLFGAMYRRLIDDHQLPAAASLTITLAYLQASVRDVNRTASDELLALAVETSQTSRLLAESQRRLEGRLAAVESLLELGDYSGPGREDQ